MVTFRWFRVSLVVGLLGTPCVVLQAADCDQDGVDDAEAIASGAQSDCNENGVPDVCEFVTVPFGALTDSLPLDAVPESVVVSDVTGDGLADLIVASKKSFRSPARITVFPSLDGTAFDSPLEVEPGENLNSVAPVDLEGDGDIDLVTVDNSGVIRRFANDGEAGFSASPELLLPWFGNAIRVADLDLDGTEDLLTVHPSEDAVSWLLNRGDGSFANVESRTVGRLPSRVVAEDFDGDGAMDLAVGSRRGERVDLLFAVVSGEGVPLELATAARDEVRGVGGLDVDGDGDLEVISSGLKGVHVWSNEGDGVFGDPMVFRGELNDQSFGDLEIGDLDSDGTLDLLVNSFTETDFHVFRNRDGALLPQQPFSADAVDFGLGDLDGDGDLDIGLASINPEQATVLWNGESVVDLIERREIPFDRPHFLDTGDLNGDGNADVITANAGDRTYSVLFGLGDGSFERTSLRRSRREGLVAVNVGDYDEDGTLDVVFRMGSTLVSLPNRDGSGDFPDWIDVQTRGFGRYLITEDIDSDGHLDLAAPDFGGNALSVHFGDGMERLGTRQDLAVGNFPWEVTAADLDGDSMLDLTTANGNSEDLSVLLQRPGRTFEAQRTIPIDGTPHAVVGVDADRDGDIDLISANHDAFDIAVFLNEGGGSFSLPRRFPVGRRPYAILATELDGDGVIDIVTTNEQSASVSILRGRGGGVFSSPQQFSVGQGPRFTGGNDFNGDGNTDLVVASRSGTQLSVFINNKPPSINVVASLLTICTALDFARVSVEEASPVVERRALFLLPTGDTPDLLPTTFPVSGRFGDPRQYLVEEEPERFPALSDTEYEALVGKRETRHYFAGGIRSIETEAGIVYGVDIVTANGDAAELLDATETAAVLAGLGEAFRLRPIVYAPRTRETQEVAMGWASPDFQVVIIETDEPMEPQEGNPTFELVVPSTMLCGVFGVGSDTRGPREELAFKSTVRLRGGTLTLPTESEQFEAELFEEVLFGPEAEVAQPDGPGVFAVRRVPGADGVTTFRFTFAQPFRLPDARRLELTIPAPFLYRARGDEPLVASQELPPAFFSALKGREPLQALLDGEPLVRYGSCDYPELPGWDVEFRLADGSRWSLLERYEEAELILDTAPAVLARAERTTEDEQETVTDYLRLIYSALRHNTEVTYWVVLDPPRPLGPVQEAVRVVELRAPEEPFRPEPAAFYLGVDLEPLAPVGVLEFSRQPRAPATFKRGDVDASGGVTVADALVVLEYLFRGLDTLPCLAAADANDSDRVNVLDAVLILDHLFRRGVLPAPAGVCGMDPTAGEVGCRDFAGCE